MTTHDFDNSLRYSHSQADAEYWPVVYRRAFPDMVTMIDLRGNGWHQKAGRDRAIVLSSGRTVYVDEKVRTDDYDDIAVEVWSVYPENGTRPWEPTEGAIPGWGREPKDCEWLAYAFEPSCTCYLLPFLGVRAAWERHAKDWIQKASSETEGYSWVEARNRRRNGSRYWSISIAVPIPELRRCINDSMTITWARRAA